MRFLDEALVAYADTEMYPFHMPGHKRQRIPFENPYCMDITEIDGFDNLHHAEGILKEAEERAASLYGSDRCFYLVGGSTCGLLSAICAATEKKDKVLVARNSHKSVYHALYLNQLKAEYLYPEITQNDLQGHITPKQVEVALLEHTDVTAVIVTSPTYEGIVSDIKGIAEVAHAHGVTLIVDSAHGAHLGFGGGFAESAVRLGADAAIMSLHKTLPAFTQTALLHLNGNRILTEKVQRYLSIFETSSPSYLLMAGMDACVRMLMEQKETLFANYRQNLNDFYHKIEKLENLHVMGAGDLNKEEAYGWDDSKLVIFTGKSGLLGEQLHQILRKRYHLQMEMASGCYVLGMTSIMDQNEGFDRLAAALIEIDKNPGKMLEETLADSISDAVIVDRCDHIEGKQDFIRRMYAKNGRQMEIYEAVDLPRQEVSYAEAVGKISSDYIYLYPPGIPLLVPGEVITETFLSKIKECIRQNLQIEGSPNLTSDRINVVYF